MSKLLLNLSSDFATKAIFGQSTDTLLSDDSSSSDDPNGSKNSEFSEAANHAVYMLGRRGLLINLYWLIDGPKFRRSCRICKNFVSARLTEARLSQPEKRSEPELENEHSASFMEALLARENAPAEVLRDQLLALLLASRDTSASFAAWVVYALVRNKRVTTKLRDSIKCQLPDRRIPAMADITALPYLRYVLNETLRHFPVVPLEARTAKVDTILPEGGGVDGKRPLLVPAGAKVAFNIYALHHRQDIFGEDANSFRPERWEDANAGPMGEFGGAFIPFIIGPRVCLGSKSILYYVAVLW